LNDKRVFQRNAQNRTNYNSPPCERLLSVLYLLAVVPILYKQQTGLRLLFAIVLFSVFGWVARKEESLAEKKREKHNEEIVSLLREIRINQRDK